MRLLLVPLLLLAACASPAPEFFGAVRHDIRLGGIDFVVFRKGAEVEVIRMGYLSRARRVAVPALMMQAAEQVTGCAAVADSLRTRIPGDTGEARITMDCD